MPTTFQTSVFNIFYLREQVVIIKIAKFIHHCDHPPQTDCKGGIYFLNIKCHKFIKKSLTAHNWQK